MMPDGRRPHWTIVARVATSPPAAGIRCGETSPGIAVDHLRARARSRWNPLTPDNPKDLCRRRRWFRGDGDLAGRRGRSAHGRAACDTRWRRCHDLARRGVGGGDRDHVLRVWRTWVDRPARWPRADADTARGRSQVRTRIG